MRRGQPRNTKVGELHALPALCGPSLESAYLLGFLWADGRLQRGGYRVGAEIGRTDLDEIAPVFLSTGAWAVDYRSRVGKRPQGTIHIHNKPFHEFLAHLGFMEKSRRPATAVLRHLPADLRFMWWRGFFDGDGCLYQNRTTCQLVFTGHHDQDWAFVEDLPHPGTVRRVITSRGHRFSQLRFTSRPTITEILQFMYPVGGPDFGLSRKRQKAATFIQVMPSSA